MANGGAPDGSVGPGPSSETFTQASDTVLPVAAPAAAFAIDAPQPGKGGSWQDDSSIEFNAVYGLFWVGPDPTANITRMGQPFDKRITLGFRVPGKGRLTLGVHVEGTQDDPGPNESFTQDITAAWNIAADAEGKLTIERDGNPELGQHKGGTVYRLDSVNPSETSTSVSLSPMFVGTSDSESVDDSTSFNAEIVSKSHGTGTSRTAAPPKVGTSITISFNPVKAPAPPAPAAPKDPEVTVTVGNVQVLVTSEYRIGPFKVRSIELESGGIKDRVWEIFNSLPETTQHDLFQGKLPGEKWKDGSKTDAGEKIEVHGYTSNTDSMDNNDKLAKRRAEAVIKEFAGVGVPETTFTKPIPHGERAVSDPADPDMKPTDDKKKEKESADWRKVVVFIKHPGE